MHGGNHGHLAHGGKGGFRFVEEVKAIAAKAFGEKREEGFAVRLAVEAFAAVTGDEFGGVAGRERVEGVDFSGDVEVTLGTQKVRIARAAKIAATIDADVAAEFDLFIGGGEVHVAAAAFGVESDRDSNSFEQSRFASAIFSHEKSNLRMNAELCQRMNCRNGKWMPIPMDNVLTEKFNTEDEWIAAVVHHGKLS